MSNFECFAVYCGDEYRHRKSGFCGVVVSEIEPTLSSPWLPERVILTLKNGAGEQRDFPLSELDEQHEAPFRDFFAHNTVTSQA